MWRGVPVRKPGVHIFGLVSPSLGQLISRNTDENSSSKSHFISFQISSLKTQIQSQESDLKSQEDDLNRAKSELNRLQQEETQLEQSIQAGKVQLETIIKSLKSTQDEINQVSKGAGWGRACHPWLGLGCGWDGASGVSCQAGWLPQAEQLQRSVRCSRCLVAPAHLIHVRFSPWEALFSLQVKCGEPPAYIPCHIDFGLVGSALPHQPSASLLECASFLEEWVRAG